MAQLVHFERTGLVGRLPGPRNEGRVRAVFFRDADDARCALDPPAIMACPLGVSRAHLVSRPLRTPRPPAPSSTTNGTI
jgi:hypothetical protein